jgi:Glycosyl hydrolase family 26
VAFLITRPGISYAEPNTYCEPDQVPVFSFGFADLKAALGDPMGEPITCEYGDPSGNGDVLQETTAGTAVWRATAGTPTFVSNVDHWALTADGLVSWSGPDLDPPTASASPEVSQPVQSASAVVDPQVAAPPDRSVYWGAYVYGAPASLAPLDAFESAIGKHVSIVHWGQSWGKPPANPFQTSRFEALRRRGSIGMVNWGSWELGPGTNQPEFRLATIADGQYDDYIRQYAQSARDWGHPFFLRFDHEMNGFWQFPWSVQLNGNSSADFVRAWRHVHDIFVQQGATNATWVWCPNVSGSRTTPLDQVYPGDDYVDWTCLDGYNFGNDGENVWQSFAQVFGGGSFGGSNPHNSYQELLTVAPAKPIMLGEVASAENGGSKAAWISDMLQSLPTQFPQVKAFVWMEWNNGDSSRSWPVRSSQASQDAFASGIASSIYSGADFAQSADNPIPVPRSAPQPSASSGSPVRLTPVADTYTSSGNPTATWAGALGTLRLDTRGSDTGFLLYDLSGLKNRGFTSVVLRLHTSAESWAGSSAAADVRLVAATDWKETFLSFRNSVPVSNTVLGTLDGSKRADAWYEIKLDSNAIHRYAGGMLSLAINTRGSDVWIVSSRESGASTAPELVVDTRS